MLYGFWADIAPINSSLFIRFEIGSIVKDFSSELTPKSHSELIDQHQNYIAKSDGKRHTASQLFFEKLKLLALLSESERHSLISNACKKLLSVHQAFDNFYNEPPFADRLAKVVRQGAVPNTIKAELVKTVLTCVVGNPYGVSNAAYPHYAKIIESFTPAEIDIMLSLPKSNTIVGNRIRSHARCNTAFKDQVGLIDQASVPTKSKITSQNPRLTRDL